jgi:hypothetical protein
LDKIYFFSSNYSEHDTSIAAGGGSTPRSACQLAGVRRFPAGTTTLFSEPQISQQGQKIYCCNYPEGYFLQRKRSSHDTKAVTNTEAPPHMNQRNLKSIRKPFMNMSRLLAGIKQILVLISINLLSKSTLSMIPDTVPDIALEIFIFSGFLACDFRVTRQK